MATGSGKTKVMSLVVAWQFLNAVREPDEIARDYARTFLVIAPNVIVFERLKLDFADGRVFRADPLIPKELGVFWDFDCVIREEGEKAHAEGTLFLTNIQQLYERADRANNDEPDPMTGVLGPKPPAQKLEMTDFTERIGLRAGHLLVINDEVTIPTTKTASGTNHPDTPYQNPSHRAARLQRHAAVPKGAIFPWTIFDYPLKQAITDDIVKRPMKASRRSTRLSQSTPA